VKFSQAVAAGSPIAAREIIAGKDAVTPAMDILALDQEGFGPAFQKSPMNLARLKRNAAAVLASR